LGSFDKKFKQWTDEENLTDNENVLKADASMDIQKVTNRDRDEGTGPGLRAADGSSVRLYRLLRPQGEPEVIRDALQPGANILELGCGVGRITHPLIKMGFHVVAVDNCAEMIAFVEGAAKITADIETLNLNEQFDAVLLMSNLINTPDTDERQAYLLTCRRHLKPDGVTIVQRYDPKWLDSAGVGRWTGLGVDLFIDRVVRQDRFVEMSIRYVSGNDVWTHSFVAERLGTNAIETALACAGLQLHRWLDSRQTWFSARLPGPH
jgi:2-polyprenyl-3-methyl-5-hydroxy-6-metoxy-1,4-benzoquinol methylase